MTLLRGAAEAIARLNAAGHPVVVVTNQSGIARGILTDAEYRAVAARMERLLEVAGARVDGSHYCPHAPEIPPVCDCRKPAVGGYRRVAASLGLDPTGAWCVGDRLSDLLPARELGGHGILVRTGQGPDHVEDALTTGFVVAEDLAAAVTEILG